MQDPQMLKFAIVGGRSAFQENCSACHGVDAQGAKGFPNLNDDDWLWGGKISDIYATIRYGVRSGHADARQSQMPAFGRDQILTKDQINDVAEHVMSFSDSKIKNDNGKKIFAEQCSSCHGPEGKGSRPLGAPNLTDKVWLYGSSKEAIMETVRNSRGGVMPHWIERLDEQTMRKLAIYVYSLGGAEKE